MNFGFRKCCRLRVGNWECTVSAKVEVLGLDLNFSSVFVVC